MRYLDLQLSDGSSIYLEEDAEKFDNGPQPAGRLHDAVVSFDAALEGIRKATGAMVASIRAAMPEEPTEMEIEFGLKGTLEANGFLIAKAASEAHYKIKMKWIKSTPSKE